MNIRRGLFRAWIFVTVLWVSGAVFITYYALPQSVARKYQFVLPIRKDVPDPNKVIGSAPLYSLIRSPTKEKVNVTFSHLDYEYVSQ